MKRLPPKKLIVLQDKQEKNPIIFPDKLRWYNADNGHLLPVSVRIADLRPLGCDYCIEGFESCVRVERKGSIDELRKNHLSGDITRQRASYSKLRTGCHWPVLLFDLSLAESYSSGHSTVDPAKVLDAALACAASNDLHVLWISGGQVGVTRQRLGTLILRIMWNAIWQQLTAS